MGTIDEAIKQVTECKAYKQCDTEKDSEAFDTLVNIARKYQKIEEIVTNNELEWGNTSVRSNALLKVKKVVEDGAENNHHASNT